VTLELGGKDAAIVLADADLERAAAGIAWAGNLNAGQACLSVERVYVVEQVAARFESMLAAEVSKLRVGSGDDPNTDVGAIITDAQLGMIEAHVADAIKRGARALCGAGRANGGRDGRFYAPTVLVDVRDDMRVMTEETFGPVIAVQRVRDADDAVERT